MTNVILQLVRKVANGMHRRTWLGCRPLALYNKSHVHWFRILVRAMLTAFVTGGNGFLGASLVRRLLAGGAHVRVLMRPGAYSPLLQHLPVEQVTGDLLAPDTYRAFLSGCDVLFHVAASYTHDPNQIATMEAVNVEGTRQVLETALAASVSRLVHTSTIGTIGQPGDGGLATEDTPFNLPHPTAYVRSKLEGERIADALAQSGAPVIVVHPTAMLGAGDLRPSASGRRVLDVLTGAPLRYPNGGINWCPVADVAQGLILAAAAGTPGRHYILGHGDGNLGRDAFIRLITQAAGLLAPRTETVALTTRARSLLRRLSSRTASPSAAGAAPDRLTCNPSRAVAELNMPQSSLPAAAQEMVTWYREHGL